MNVLVVFGSTHEFQCTCIKPNQLDHVLPFSCLMLVSLLGRFPYFPVHQNIILYNILLDCPGAEFLFSQRTLLAQNRSAFSAFDLQFLSQADGKFTGGKTLSLCNL